MIKADILTLNKVLGSLQITSPAISPSTRARVMAIKLKISPLTSQILQQRDLIVKEIESCEESRRNGLFQELFAPILMEEIELEFEKLTLPMVESLLDGASLKVFELELLYKYILD